MLYRLGLVHLAQGRAKDGREELERALAVYRALGDSRGVAGSLLQVGRAARGLSDSAGALAAYRESLALWEALGGVEEQASIHNNIGLVDYDLGQPNEARDAYLRALALFRREGNRQRELTVLNNLGGVYELSGGLPEALDHYGQALALARALGRRNAEADALNNLAGVYRSLGKLHQALDHYDQALDLFRASGDLRRQAAALNNLGLLLRDLGEAERARGMLAEALPLSRQTGDARGERAVLVNLALASLDLGRLDEAADLLAQALALSRRIEDRTGEAAALKNLGFLEIARARPEMAAARFREALALVRALGSRADETMAERGLGQALAALDDRGGARQAFERALHLAQDLGDPAEQARTLQEMARGERARGELDPARSHLEQALERIESLRSEVAGQRLRATHFAALREAYEMYVDVLALLHKAHPEAGFDAQALAAAERARARGLYDFLRRAEVDLWNADPGLLAEEERLSRELSARADLQARLAAGGKEQEAAAAQRELTALLAQYEIVDSRLRAGDPLQARLRRPALEAAEIRGLLGADTVLLEVSLGEPRSYLWKVTPSSLAMFELPGRERIEALARRAHDLLGSPSPKDAAEEKRVLADLSALLLGPVQRDLRDERLVVVTEGALLYVPFAALPVPEPAGGTVPLVVRHEVVALPSAAVLSELRRSAAGRERRALSLAVLADPVLSAGDPRMASAAHLPAPDRSDLRGDSGLPTARLPWTGREAETITAEAGVRPVLLALGLEANRDLALSPRLRDFRIVHFATHGVIDSRSPELSGLVFSRIDDRGLPRDGVLRLVDIYRLRLGADLVVLSGCETALGEKIRGEGLVGLTHGFLHAGATQVLSSLWPVRDRATAELMRLFYHGLFHDGLAPAAALRQAQVSLWRQRASRSPFYWAAFVLQGDWTGSLHP